MAIKYKATDPATVRQEDRPAQIQRVKEEYEQAKTAGTAAGAKTSAASGSPLNRNVRDAQVRQAWASRPATERFAPTTSATGPAKAVPRPTTVQRLNALSNSIGQREQQLTNMGLQLNQLETAYNAGDYSAVDKYNALANQYNTVFNQYVADVDSYNKLYRGEYRDQGIRNNYARSQYGQAVKEARQATRDQGSRQLYEQRRQEEALRAPQLTTIGKENEQVVERTPNRVERVIGAGLSGTASGFSTAAGLTLNNQFNESDTLTVRRKGASVGEHSQKRINGETERDAGYTYSVSPEYLQRKAYGRITADGLIDTGRKLNTRSNLQTDIAKEGLGEVGQAIVDLGVMAVQMAADIGIAAATGGSMLVPLGIRSYGNGYLTAEQMGFTGDAAQSYALGVAAVEVLSEKMFSVFGIVNKFARGAVTQEMSERVIDGLVKRLASSAGGRTALNRLFTILFSAGSEGLEEVIAGVAEPLIRKYTLDSDVKAWKEIDWQEALYEGLLGGLLGGLGGAVDLTNTRPTYWKYYKEGIDESIGRYEAAVKKYGLDSKEAQQAAKEVWDGGTQKMNAVAGFIVGANENGEGGTYVPIQQATTKDADNGLAVTYHQLAAAEETVRYGKTDAQGNQVQGPRIADSLYLGKYLKNEEKIRRQEAARREEAARLEAEEKARVDAEKTAQSARDVGTSAQGELTETSRGITPNEDGTVRLDTARSAQTRAQAPQDVADLSGIPEDQLTQEERDELQYGIGAVEDLGRYTGLAQRMGQAGSVAPGQAGPVAAPRSRGLLRSLRTPGVQQQAANLQQRVGGLRVAYTPMPKNMPGYVDRSTGTIYLNSNVSKDKLLRSTLGHELVHYLKKQDPQLIGDIIAYMEQIGEDVQGEIARLRPMYEESIRKIYAANPAKMQQKLAELDEPGYFEEEVAANFIGRICEEQSETLDRLAAEEPGLLQRIVEALRRFLRELGATPEGQERIQVYEQAIARVNEALAKAGQGTETGLEDTKHLFTEIESDAAPDELAPDELPAELVSNLEFDDDVRFNLRSMEEDKEDFRKDLGDIMDEAELDELFDAVDAVMDYVSQHREELDYGAELSRYNRPFLPVKPNSDEHYKFAIDFSTLCRKRILIQAITERLQQELGRGLSPMESVRIREELVKLRDAGAKIDVACGLCYVEAARFNAMKYVNTFLADPRAVMIDYLSKKNRTWIRNVLEPMQQRYWESLGKTGKYNKQKLNTEQKNKINEENKKLRATYKPESEQELALLQRLEEIDKNQFLSVDGLTKLAADEETYPIYDAFITFLRDRGRAKAQESRSPYYKGDLMRATSGGKKLVTEAMLLQLNEESGSRMQSWSDFEVLHLLDLMSAVMDLALNKAKAHCYTKVPDLVRVAGKTGVMYNMSLIPAGDTGLNAEGKLDASCYDPHEGIPFEVMQELREQFPDTAGNICIGINDAQIRALMASPDIDFIIPYHESGLPKELKAMLGLHDWDSYQQWQNEKPDSHKTGDRKKPALRDWFSIEEARSFDGDGYAYMEYASRKYLKYCDEHGLVPVFPMFTGEDHLTPEPGYWKLLIDRKMVNQKTREIIEQQVVRPRFDKDVLLDVMQREIDSDVRQEQQQAIDTVVDRVLSGQTSLSQQMDQDLRALSVLLQDAPMLNAVEHAGEENGEDVKHRFLPEEEESGEQTEAEKTTPESEMQTAIRLLSEQITKLAQALRPEVVAKTEPEQTGAVAAETKQKEATETSEAPVSQAINSAKTSIKQIPALFRNKNVEFGETNIDIGGGRFDLATDYLRSIGTENMVFDPYNRSAETNSATLRFLQEGNKADTATCANVLNVIREPEARANVILEAAKAIKPDGAAYFMVYEGDGSGTGKQTSSGWQNNRPTASYVSEIEQYFGDVTRQGKLITAREPIADLPQAAWEISPGSAVRFSFVEGEGEPKNKYGIDDDVVKAIQGIGRKSVNSFTSAEINKTEKFARKFWEELGVKSPFFRAWFGDWRAYDTTPITIVPVTRGQQYKAGRTIIADTKRTDAGGQSNGTAISWGDTFKRETITHKPGSGISADIIGNIEALAQNAVLLDTYVSEPTGKSKMPGTAFMHSFYVLANDGTEISLFKLFAEEALSAREEVFMRAYELKDIVKVTTLTNGVLPGTGGLTNVNIATINSVADLYNLVKTYDKQFTPAPEVDRAMLEDDGKPKRMYRGDPEEFYIFDRKKAKPNRLYGRAFYFTSSPEHASQYGDVREFFLNVRRPLSPGQNKISKEQMRRFLQAVAEDEDYGLDNYGYGSTVESVLANVYGKGDFEMLQDVNASCIGDLVAALELFNQVNGTKYDGIITPTETVVLDSTQIKSATDNIGTFDRSNPDVRYSFTEEEGAEAEAPKDLESMEPSERAKELIAAAAHAKQVQKQTQKILRSLRLTPKETALANDILDGTLTVNEMRRSTYDQPVDKRKVERAYEAKRAAREAQAPVDEYNKQRRADLDSNVEALTENSDEWKDHKNMFAYARETARRNFYGLTKDAAEAEAMIGYFIDPIREHEAAKNRMVSRYNDRIKKLGIETRKRKGNKVSEAYAIQFIGELEFIRDWLESLPEGETRDGVTYQEAMTLLDEFWRENPNFDKDRIYAAVAEFRGIYDELFAMVNEARVLNGYAPIDYRKGYFPHFSSNNADNIIQALANGMGIGVEVTELPTSIAGTTHLFRPGIQWSGHMQRRVGNETDYNVLEGWDRYIPAVANIIYHTEDIQKLRALERVLRQKYNPKTVSDEIDSTHRSTEMTAEEKYEALDKLFNRDTTQLNYFVQWVREYTNQLAGKRAETDRNVEKNIGRSIYSSIQKIENRVAANMLGGNISSAMTNFVPLFQAWGNVSTASMLRAMWDTGLAAIRRDGFRDGSDFLVNRRGYDAMYQTLFGKTKNALFLPFNIIDDFVSETIVRARYYDELRSGLSPEAALMAADTFAGSVMADRAVGELPTIFNSKNPIYKVFTMFQVEVNNDLSHLIKDIPRDAKKHGMAALFMSLLKYMLGVYMFNDLFEWLFGRRVSLDPLSMLNDLVGDATGYELPNMFESAALIAKGEWQGWEEFENGKGGNFLSDLIKDAKNWADDLPFISGILNGGRYPIRNILPEKGSWDPAWEALQDILKGEDRENTEEYDLSKMYKFIKNPLWYWASPAFGGQARKIAEGIQAYTQHGSYSQTKQGKVLQYPILGYDDLVKSMIFGKTTTRYGKEWIESDFDSLTAPQTEAYINLVSGGSDPELIYQILHDLKGTERTAVEKAYALATANLDDGERIMLFGALDRDKEAENFADLMLSGLTFRQCADVLDEYRRLKDLEDQTAKGDEGTAERRRLSTEFSIFLADQGFDDKTINAVQEVYDMQVKPIRYDWLTAAGIHREGAMELALDWSELEPRGNSSKVTDNQKVMAVADAGYLSENEKHMAIRTLLTEDEAAKYNQYIVDYQIPVETYGNYIELSYDLKADDLDGDGKGDAYSLAKKKFAVIDRLPLQPGQKTALAIYASGNKESTVRKYAPWLQ